MSFPAQLIFLFAIFAPVFILILIGRLKVRRKNRQQELEGDVPTPPFEPVSESQPGIFLRRFTPAQRVYLREQRATARFGGPYAAWIFFALLCSGLLPQFVDRYGIDQSLPQRVWFSYLSQFAMGCGACGFIALFAALIALSNLVSISAASYIRTRPLTLRFLFWARVGPALATLLAAFLTAAACSFLLLVALHGPVWKHLFPDSHSGARAVFYGEHAQIEAMHLAVSVQTSPLRLLFSAITSTLLTFSFVAVLMTLPLRNQRSRPFGVFSWCFALLLLYEGFIMAGGSISPHVARILFLYSNPGPPPPYVFALIPLLLSIAFLCLAQFQAARLET
jgi:hypothetical protein